MPTSLLFPSSYYFAPRSRYHFGIADNYSVVDANISPIDSCCPAPAAAAAAEEKRDFDFEKKKYLKQFGDFAYILEDENSTRQYEEGRKRWQSRILGPDQYIEQCYQDWPSSYEEDREVEMLVMGLVAMQLGGSSQAI